MTSRQHGRAWRFLAGAILAAAPALTASAAVIRFDPPAATFGPGDAVVIRLVADFGGESVIGWGLDVSFDPQVLAMSDPPVIGPFWEAAFAPDGDALAGSANPFTDPDHNGLFGSIGGNSVLLATLHFTSVGLGHTELVASATPGDLNEGFALDPSGFASVVYQPGSVTIVPEPACASLIVPLAGLVRRRRRAPRQRRDPPAKRAVLHGPS
ncbi:MAG: hypothetical protein HRF43_07715 [Phycisphaerae bacterium]|jgi:hypothetical protein